MEWVKLDEICTPKQWKTIPQSEFTIDGYPVFGANGKIGYYKDYNHEKPTIMITCRGATCGTINISEPYSYITGNAMALDDLDDTKYNLHFIYFFLKYRGLNDTISGSAQPQITRTNLNIVKIPAISIEEQDLIVNKLLKLKTLIQTRQDQIQALDDLVESVLYNFLNNYISNQVDISEVLVKIISGKSLAGDTPSNYRVLKTSCLYSGYFDENEWKYLPVDYTPSEDHFIKKDDILVSRMNTEELVGANVYVWKNYPNLTNPDRIWRLITNDKINNIYLWKLMQTNFYKNQIYKISTGTSGSMKNISQKNFADIKIILPPISQQNLFAAFVEKIEKQKQILNDSLKELTDLFDSLMQDAFDGSMSK